MATCTATAQARCFDLVSDCIMSARDNARQVREQISSEMWEQLNRLFHEVKRIGTSDLWDSQPLDYLVTVRESTHLFHGLTDSTMNHGEGWQFIQVGRFMERAMAIARLLDVYFDEFLSLPDQAMDSTAHLEWIGLLRSCSAFESYCRVYTADLRPERIAEFLLLNAEFPHSVRFAVDKLEQSLEAINETTSSKKAARVANWQVVCRAELTLYTARRDHDESARIPGHDTPAVRPDQQRRVPGVHHLSDRGRAAGLTGPEEKCSIPSGTLPNSAIANR